MSSPALFVAVAAGLSAAAALALAARLGLLRRRAARAARVRAALAEAWPRIEAGAPPPPALAAEPGLLLDAVIELRQSLEAGSAAKASLAAALEDSAPVHALVKRLLRGGPDARAEAASRLAYVGGARASRVLALALMREAPGPARVAIAEALAVIGDAAFLPSIVDALSGASPEDRSRIGAIATAFGDDFLALVPSLAGREEPEILELLFAAASRSPSYALGEFVRSRLRDPDPATRRAACLRFLSAYASQAEVEALLADEDRAVRSAAIRRLGASPSVGNFETLVALLAEPAARADARAALADLVTVSPALFGRLVARLRGAGDPMLRGRLLAIVALRVEYCLARLAEDPNGDFALAVGNVLDSGRTAGVVNLLNRNRDPAVEEASVALLAGRLREGKDLGEELEQRLDPRLLERLGLKRREVPAAPGKRDERVQRLPLFVILALVAVLPPAAYLLSAGRAASPAGFVAAFIRAFTLYALVLNGLTIVLAALSFAASRRQARRLGRKTDAFLFREAMLPSISVIAPAYNEEASIVESVRSLLNLRYPDYEVIVVNDGSKDKTLGLLIENFDLVKRDLPLGTALKTRRVRGLYASPRWPGLLVVDKENGGKADSLNAGINAATKRLFAGIDSDSLLERDSLLRVAASWLDYREPVVAAGGNILPANGCAVSYGDLVEIRAPRTLLPLFQSVEYLRSFMNGRLGWSTLRALLIISGAFGLFDRDRVVEAGGYLTSRERYLKDTVGEDMELVVRLTRLMRERGEPFRVHYEAKATCWTEAPSNLAVLKRQRNRWQRGLLDILTFHRRIFLNPRYGAVGLLAFPYFLAFEVIGPWFEFLALAITLVSPALLPGWPVAVLGAFAASVLLGSAASLLSLAIAEWDGPVFGTADHFRLAAASVAENFGFRQLMGFYRLGGYLSALRGASGWGAMTRSGFAAKGTKR